MSAGPSDPPVRSLEQLLERQAQAALEVGRAGKSCWNGRVERLPRPGDPRNVLGMADWDGTLRYSETRVLRPLRQMFARGGRRLTALALATYKEALLTVFHENNHLLAPCDQEHRDGRAGWDWSTMLLEEGVTETYSRRRLEEFTTLMGLEAIAPGIAAAQIPAAYPQYVPAVEAVVAWVAGQTETTVDDVLRQLNAETAAGKYRRLVTLAIGGRARRMDPDRLTACRKELERTLRRVLGKARLFPMSRSQAFDELSGWLGSEAVEVLEEQLAAIDGVYRSPHPLPPTRLPHRPGRGPVHRSPAPAIPTRRAAIRERPSSGLSV